MWAIQGFENPWESDLDFNSDANNSLQFQNENPASINGLKKLYARICTPDSNMFESQRESCHEDTETLRSIVPQDVDRFFNFAPNNAQENNLIAELGLPGPCRESFNEEHDDLPSKPADDDECSHLGTNHFEVNKFIPENLAQFTPALDSAGYRDKAPVSSSLKIDSTPFNPVEAHQKEISTFLDSFNSDYFEVSESEIKEIGPYWDFYQEIYEKLIDLRLSLPFPYFSINWIERDRQKEDFLYMRKICLILQELNQIRQSILRSQANEFTIATLMRETERVEKECLEYRHVDPDHEYILNKTCLYWDFEVQYREFEESSKGKTTVIQEKELEKLISDFDQKLKKVEVLHPGSPPTVRDILQKPPLLGNYNDLRFVLEFASKIYGEDESFCYNRQSVKESFGKSFDKFSQELSTSSSSTDSCSTKDSESSSENRSSKEISRVIKHPAKFKDKLKKCRINMPITKIKNCIQSKLKGLAHLVTSSVPLKKYSYSTFIKGGSQGEILYKIILGNIALRCLVQDKMTSVLANPTGNQGVFIRYVIGSGLSFKNKIDLLDLECKRIRQLAKTLSDGIQELKRKLDKDWLSLFQEIEAILDSETTSPLQNDQTVEKTRIVPDFSKNDIKETEAKLDFEMPLPLSVDQTFKKSEVLYQFLTKDINEINNLLIKVGPSLPSQEKWKMLEQNLSVRMRAGQVITMLEFREQRRALQQWKQYFDEILQKIGQERIRIADSMIFYDEDDTGEFGTKRFKGD